MDIITLALARQSVASAVAGAIQGLDNIYAKKADVPALKHHHDVSDIMVATKTGGAYSQNLLQLTTDAYTTAMLKPEVNSVITSHTDIENVEDFMGYFNSHSSSPLTTSDGKTYYPVVQMVPTVLIWPLIAGTAPMSSVQFGDLAQIPCNFDGQDLSQMIVIPTENKIAFQLLSHKYPGVEDHLSADEWIPILSGNFPEEQAAIDEFCARFGEQTATLTIQRLDDDGQLIDPAITGYETTLFEHDATSWGIYIFILIPAEHMDEMQHISDDEALTSAKFSFDEIEPESVLTETPLIDTLHEMNTNIDKLKTDKINIDRVCKITYNTYGGPYSGSIGSLFGIVPEIDGVYMGSTSQASIGEKLVGNNYKYEYQDRFKIGSVFQKETDENGQVTYRYLGRANELNGLEYTCGKDYDMEEPLTERFINSIRKAWTDDVTGEIDNNKIQNAGSLLNDDAFMFITILDDDLYSSIIYGFWKVENNSAYIDIKKIIPEGTDTSYEWLNDMINNTNNAANQAQSTANQANTTAQSAQSTAESAQSTANQANTTAQSAQSAAESADTKATQAQSAAESADTKATQAQSAAESAASAASTADTKATQAQSTAESADTKATQAQSTATVATYGLPVAWRGVKTTIGQPLKMHFYDFPLLFQSVFGQRSAITKPTWKLGLANATTEASISTVNSIKKYKIVLDYNAVIRTISQTYTNNVPFGTLLTGPVNNVDTTIIGYQPNNLTLQVYAQNDPINALVGYSNIVQQYWNHNYSHHGEPIGQLNYFIPTTREELQQFLSTTNPQSYFDENNFGAFTLYAERRHHSETEVDDYSVYDYYMVLYLNVTTNQIEAHSDIIATKQIEYIYPYLTNVVAFNSQMQTYWWNNKISYT